MVVKHLCMTAIPGDLLNKRLISMLNENTYHEVEPALAALNSSRSMNAKLTDIDRRAVDLLLAGDSSAEDGGIAPAMLERVNTARRLLGMLNAMSPEEPSSGLADATLRRVAAFQAQADAQSSSQPTV
jgi:hypothetical protein